jgi:hypothetical protein
MKNFNIFIKKLLSVNSYITIFRLNSVSLWALGGVEYYAF